MFRAVPCSSSGGQIVLLQPLVSSLSVNSHTVILNVFRAVPCSSSGGQIVLLQPLVSSLSVNSRTVCQLRADSVLKDAHQQPSPTVSSHSSRVPTGHQELS